jgi:hypothetical protein
VTDEVFDSAMHAAHIHRAINVLEDANDSSLDHAVAGTTRLRYLTRRSVGPDLLRNAARKGIKNARKRWGMVSVVST